MTIQYSSVPQASDDESNSAKFGFQEKDEDSTCSECGGERTWCTSCEMYSRTCCEEFGTCMCS